jgi:filamentous hemagglutinin family protein
MPKRQRHPVPKRKTQVLKPKLIAASVAACFAVSAQQSYANPTGPSVVSGSASFNSAANALTVTNSNNAIINWQGFSIGVNEITRFVQPSSGSAVLNRVTGAGGVIPQSVIDGVLSSNGRVFLLNPSGIVIGATAQIDVAGLVASSLNLSNDDFLANRLRFTEVPGAGAVVNNGAIETPSGGRVYLVAPSVENNGLIRTPQGEIVLAAGKEVELVSEASPFVTVRVTADSEQAVNLGQMVAEAGRVGMFGALVRQGGVAQANSAVVGENGQIRLVATKDLTLEAGSATTANGPSGGDVLLQAEGGTNLVAGRVEATGSAGKGGQVQALGLRVGVIGSGVIDASGDTGGGTVLVGGDYQGKNPEVQNAERTYIGADGVIRADAMTTGDGGRVIVWADEDTRFFGSISARGGAQGGNGGFVETSAPSLSVMGHVDTRAPNGTGGTWLLDPDYINISGTAGSLTCNGNMICFDDLPATTDIDVGTIDEALLGNTYVELQAHNDITLGTDLTLANTGEFIARAGNNINLKSFNISIHGNLTLSADDSSTTAPGPSGFGAITADAGFGNIGTDGGSVSLSGKAITVGTIDTSNALGIGNYISASSVGAVTLGKLTSGGGSVNLHGLSVTTGDIDTRGPATGEIGSGVVFIDTEPGAGDIQTGSIITRSQHPYWSGADVTLKTDEGNITVTGTIDASGANGTTVPYDECGDPCFIDLPDGSSGGTIRLLRESTASAGSISVSQDILSFGGNGVADATKLVGWGGHGGSISVEGYGGGTAYGDIFVAGNIDVHGGAGANALASGYGGGTGGFGGDVNLDATKDVTAQGALGINANGGLGGKGASGTLSSDVVDTDTSIDAGFGGSGGGGGSIRIYAGGSILTTAISASGGDGMAGADGAIASANATSTGGYLNADVYSGRGGDGGYRGRIELSAGGSVTTGDLSANGGAGGDGAIGAAAYGTSAGNASAQAGLGGSGQRGGYVIVYGGTGITTGAIHVYGGAGGSGGADSYASAQSSYGYGSASASAFAGLGGDGGGGGQAVLNSGGAVKTGGIVANGGKGGNGGPNATALANADAPSGTAYPLASAGSGGYAGAGYYASALEIFAGGDIETGAISAYGGAGGNAAPLVTLDATGSGLSVSPSRTFPNGGGAADGRGVVLDTTSGAITVYGSIDASGGTGGIGGSDGVYGGNGGAGGSGSFFSLDTSYIDIDGNPHNAYTDTGVRLVATGAISADNVYAYGGNGGDGGAGSSAGAYGGQGSWGGIGGLVLIDATASPAGSVDIPGVIDASGGAGGPGGAYGGSGGSGADAAIGWKDDSWTDLVTTYTYSHSSNVPSVQVAADGAVQVGAVHAYGGQGGNGGPIAGYGGGAASGGSGGWIMMKGSSIAVGNQGISAHGGNGGKGTDGAGTIFGGSGGDGGEGGTVTLDALGGINVLGPISVGGGDGGLGGALGGWGGYAGGARYSSFYSYAYDCTPGCASIYTYFPDGVTLTAVGAISVADIIARGGAGGDGGAAGPISSGRDGSSGGAGTSVLLASSGADVTVNGTIDSSGGAGGKGGDGYWDGAYLWSAGWGGSGADAGTVDVSAATAIGGTITITGDINASGGAGGAGGALGGGGGQGGTGAVSYTSWSYVGADTFTHYVYTDGPGVRLVAGDAIGVTSIYAYGGAGGAGKAGDLAAIAAGYGGGGSGGSGGGGGVVQIDTLGYPSGAIAVSGAIDTSGGAGGAGGAYGGSGGSAGHAGVGSQTDSWYDPTYYHEIHTVSPGISIAASAAVSVGGGLADAGGDGGLVGNSGGYGGSGGAAGYGGWVDIQADSISVGAAGILAHGGVGASGGAGSTGTLQGGAGGTGGHGGTVFLNAVNGISVNGAIDVGAGSGGDGGIYGGSGAAGGDRAHTGIYTVDCSGAGCVNGGSDQPNGIELTAGGQIGVAGMVARGGSGGAGGDGDSSFVSGDGGMGGNAQKIQLSTPASTITVNGMVDVEGGSAGLAGFPGTAGAGVDGSPGAVGSVAMTADTVYWIADQIANYDINAATLFNWIPATSTLAVGLDTSFFTGINAPLVRVGSGTTTGDITIVGALTFNNLSLVTTGAIAQNSGATLSGNGLNAYGGSVLLADINSVATLQGAATSGDFMFNNDAALDIGTVDTAYPLGLTVSGALTLTTIGPITQSATVSVAGISVIDAGTSAITLTDANNDFGNLVAAGGTDIQLTDANALMVVLSDTGTSTIVAGDALLVSGDVAGDLNTYTTGTGTTTFGMTTVGGNLAATSAGAINQGDVLTVTGTTSLDAVANSIILDLSNDFGSAVTATGAGIQLTDINALTAVLNDSGTSTLSAGGDLAVSGSAAGLNTTTTGTGTTTFGPTTVSGALGVTSAGAVSQTGALSVTGTSSIDAGTSAITLADAGNDFQGMVSLAGSTTQIVDANALALATLATGDLTVASTGALDLGQGTVAGNLVADSGGAAIVQSGGLTVTGTSDMTASGAAITLTQAGNDFNGAVTATGAGIQLTDINALTAVLNDSGTSTLSAGGDLAVSGSVAGALNTTTTSGGTTSFGVTTIGGGLLVASAGAVSQTGALSVAGTASVTAAGAAITLTNAGNDFQSVLSLDGSGISVVDTNALTVSLLDGGSSTVTAGDNLAVSGDVAANLSTTTSGTGTTSFGTTNVGGNLLVASAGAVSQTGGIAVAGTSDVSAGANAITLDNAGNDFLGAVTLASTGSGVSVRDQNDLILSAPTLGTNTSLTAIAAGTLTLPAASISTGTGNIDLQSNGGTLTTAGDLATTSGSISLTGSGGVSIGHNLTTTLAGGTLTLSSTNSAITQTAGTISIADAASASAGTGAVTLTGASNDFQGAVSLAGGATQIVDANTLTLGTLATGNLTASSSGALNLGQGTVTGSLVADSGGAAITQSGALTVTGTSDLTASGAAITLTQANDFQGNVSAAGTGVSISDANALTVALSDAGTSTLNAGGDLAVSGSAAGLNTTTTGTGTTSFGAMTVSGALDATSAGAVSQTGALNVASLSVSSGGNVTLGDSGNVIPVVTLASSPGNDVLIVHGDGTLMNVQSANAANLTFVSDQVIFSGAVNATNSVEYYTANDAAIGVTPTFFNNVTAPLMRLGKSTMTADISLTGAIALTTITDLSLVTGGTISQTASDSLTVTGLNAQGGTVNLAGANSVANLQGGAGSGTFYFVNAGAVDLRTVDPANATAGVVSAGTLYVSADGGITSSVGAASYALQGTDVNVYASAGALGSAATPLEVAASSLNAGGATGVYLNSNQYSAAPVTVNLLENLTSGDIRLNAWGGAQVTTLVYNPGGNVYIYTHSPLDVLAGITAGQGIYLATGGAASNDMLLNGVFTHGIGYDFSVAVASPGVITYGSSYDGTITILNGVPQGVNPILEAEVIQSVGTTLSGTERAQDAGTVQGGSNDEEEKKKKGDKKGPTVCK